MTGITRVVAGVSGAGLLIAPFLPWAESGDSLATGWQMSSGFSVLAILAGLVAIAAAATGGRIGFFRPDVSLKGAGDLFGVTTTAVVACVMFLDMPAGAAPAYGAVIALAGAIAVATVCGDYSVLRGAPAFPRLGSGGDAR
jgi:hypothetical protein